MSKKNTSKPAPTKPRTAKEAKALFTAYGITVTEFCEKHKLNRMTVVDLLRGLGKGTRGDSHKAAVLLGMKPDPKTKHIAHPFEEMEAAA